MEGELQVTVGRRVRRLRQERGISQEALARDVDMHRTYLGGVERGERNLTLRSVERLADRLGVPVRDLIGDAPEG
ncbi:helix-turn-helix transcriptional regulator [Cellulomonas hominis]|uniref:Helix-turn-helix transcriptional regulator n=1 Tax=Cellulomonas hominis TaxID=156981 RepID=A0A7Z8JW87_9CELL|nr:helix-turn-helix transcriptional regulator [Cellulomonas hominis]TKR22057.1 helix-turn-helix transcriptional regulator [Cellulomonas hominis]